MKCSSIVNLKGYVYGSITEACERGGNQAVEETARCGVNTIAGLPCDDLVRTRFFFVPFRSRDGLCGPVLR